MRLIDFQIDADFYKLLTNRRIYNTIIMLIACIAYSPEVRSAFEKREVGASSFAIGNAAVAIDDYLFALYYNPAALLPSEKIRMAFTVQNYHGISDLNSVDLTTCFSMASHPISVAINRFGDPRYNELQISAGTRFEILKNCAIGFSVQCYILSIRGYGQAQAWGTNLAVLYKLLPEINIGAMMTNLNRPTISEVKEQLPQTMSLGVGYIPVDNLTLSLEIFQDTRHPTEVRFGCSYQVLPPLTIRVGIEDRLDLYNYGIGINMSWIIIDYALRNHGVLGISHIATLSFVL